MEFAPGAVDTIASVGQHGCPKCPRYGCEDLEVMAER